MTSMDHVHAQAPANPKDGDRLTCSCCDYAAEFVVLDDGQPGEWIGISQPTTSAGQPIDLLAALQRSLDAAKAGGK